MKLDPALLRHVNVFRDAREEDLQLFVEKGILRSIEEGEFFFFQGLQLPTGMFWLPEERNYCKPAKRVSR